MQGTLVLVDFDNVADSGIIMEDGWVERRVGPIGPVQRRIAVGDYGRRRHQRRALARQGFEIVQVPRERGPNHADLRLALEAQAAALSGQVSRIVLVSGDGDFLPLVQRLAGRGVRVDAIAPRNSASRRLKREIRRHGGEYAVQ